MDYLKFNCYDIAAQNNELHSVYRKMQSFNDELVSILNALDPQIKGYEELLNQFTASQQSVADITMCILSLYNDLEKVTDIYYSAENRALEETRNLPISISLMSIMRGDTRNVVPVLNSSISSINSSNIILEDWLVELIYNAKGSENSG